MSSFLCVRVTAAYIARHLSVCISLSYFNRIDLFPKMNYLHRTVLFENWPLILLGSEYGLMDIYGESPDLYKNHYLNIFILHLMTAMFYGGRFFISYVNMKSYG